MNTSQPDKYREKIDGDDQNLRDLWDRRSNTVPSQFWKKRSKVGANKVLEEIMAKNFPSLARDIKLQISEAERTPKRGKLKEIFVKTHHN